MRSHCWREGRTVGIRLMLLVAIVSCPPGKAAPTNPTEEQSVGARESLVAADDAKKVEAECARCHENVVRGFVNNPHARLGQTGAGGSGAICAGCHGSSEAHIQ